MKRITFFIILLAALFQLSLAQNINDGNFGDDNGFQQANRVNRDTTKRDKVIPKGLKVWTIDEMYGDREASVPDTVHHLYQNSIFTNGLYGEYNNLGNVGSPRINRIFIDQAERRDFIFLEPYDFFVTYPNEIKFTNTLSPITNLSYNSCGSGNYGEDHFKALFGVNAGKKLGLGMKFDYIYGRGYYQSANTSHFNWSLWGSYIGERYNSHLYVSLNHQKILENGGIANDEHVLHPESFPESYDSYEIPTILSNNSARNDNQIIFYTHRYSFGFNRQVPMTEEEIEAKKFAMKSKEENDAKKALEKARKEKGEDFDLEEYKKELEAKKAVAPTDTTSKNNPKEWMKDEYVPVTSIIHTVNVKNHDRTYFAYNTPEKYYAHKYFEALGDGTYSGDSICDDTKNISVKNTVALAMLEGFNKWVPMGLKLFAAYEYQRFTLPNLQGVVEKYHENDVSVGGQLQKTLGKTFHYNVSLEAYVLGGMAGDINLEGAGDLNFPLFGDTVSLNAKAKFQRATPTFYYENYHSKHFWWDNDFDKLTHFRVEGLLNIGKTSTKLRVAYDNITKLPYFLRSYTITDKFTRENTDIVVKQGPNVSLFTAQLSQHLRLGPVNLEAIVTYQKSSDSEVIPVPALNIYANLYLKFKIAKVLATELGGDIRYFTSYCAPEYSPGFGYYCSQGNGENNIKVGNYPIINVYANFHLKHARFFVMMSHINSTAGNYFLTPHYPQNTSTFRFGVSWNFFN
ncbi:MAG: hypothetical protein HUK06_00450 [Bacteroidaceae bacterium]|nr:hypothetical protein [Bacteroidaceae bacterium]